MSSKSPQHDGDDLARRVGQEMLARDTASKALGMELVEMREGYARLVMRVRPDMLNGLGSCHGGMIFCLADSAFAFACNSRNEASVAAGCSIEFLAAVAPGAVLTAEARERARSGRRGVYEISVSNEAGEIVALFCGKSGRVKGEVIGADPLF